MGQEDKPAMAARIMAAGGGGLQDGCPLLEQFAAWTGATGRVLFLPIAQAGTGRPFAECLAWGRATLEPFGIRDITMWTDLSAEDHSGLAEFDAVFIGGGNTFSLLDQVRRSGFDTALVRFLSGGGAVYGGSAGAILLGRDILTCAHLDENHMGLDDTRGLGVLGGYCAWCHYRPEDDGRIAEYIARHGWPVLALSERAGVSAEGSILSARGYDPTYVFTAGDVQVIPVGAEIPTTGRV